MIYGKVFALLALPQLFSQSKSQEADIVIYGGTSAAITAAVQSKRMGKSVIVVSPDERLGGLTSNGLSWTDNEMKEVIGGIAREFYHRVWRYYQTPDVWKWQKFDDFGNRGQGLLQLMGIKGRCGYLNPKQQRIYLIHGLLRME